MKNLRFAAVSAAAVFGLFLGCLGIPTASQNAWAQDAAAVTIAPGSLTADQIKTDRDAWRKADCSNCHGWSGNGHDTGPIPPGPSLRDSQLEYSDIRETIACGRPGTSMPSHDRLAWGVDKCFGMSAADVGHTKPQKGTPLRPEDINAVAAYVAGYLKGRGPTSKAECEEYFGAGNAACSSYQ